MAQFKLDAVHKSAELCRARGTDDVFPNASRTCGTLSYRTHSAYRIILCYIAYIVGMVTCTAPQPTQATNLGNVGFTIAVLNAYYTLYPFIHILLICSIRRRRRGVLVDLCFKYGVLGNVMAIFAYLVFANFTRLICVIVHTYIYKDFIIVRRWL